MRPSVLVLTFSLVAMPFAVACGSDQSASSSDGGADGPNVPNDGGADVAVLDASTDSGDTGPGTDASDGGGCVGPKFPGLLAWWKGENNETDETGSVPLTGSVGYAAGEVGQGFNFTAVNGITGTASPALDGLNAITIEGWIYTRTNSGVIVTRRYNTGYQFEIGPYLTFSVGCGSGNCVGTSTTAPKLNTFTHVAVTYDSTLTAGAIQFYVDGVSAGTGTGPGAGPIANDLATIYVGSIHTVTGGAFDGIIDELSIYNTVLKPADIAAIYAAGAKGKCK